MNCAEIREQLALYVYDDLAPDDATQVRTHLESCAACRQEEQGLLKVRQRLNLVPVREPSVSSELIYRMVAQRQATLARRWRRAAVLAASIAAMAALVVGLRIQVHIERHQLTLRWSDAPVTTTAAMPPVPKVAAEPEPVIVAAPSLEQVQVLSELLQGQHDSIAQLEHLVAMLRRELATRARQWQSTERDVAALATSSRTSFEKGGSQ